MSTPLHWASRGGHVGVALLLLGHGVDASSQNNFKSTPLHLAMQGGHVEVTRALLKYGADASAHDEDKLTPLTSAVRCTCSIVECKHLEVAQVLVEHRRHSNEQMARLPGIT